MHLFTYEEAWYEFGKVVLDVSTTSRTLRSEREEHAMAVSDLHVVQRLESYCNSWHDEACYEYQILGLASFEMNQNSTSINNDKSTMRPHDKTGGE